MASFDWKQIIRTVAPVAASALGTPAMGLAVTALSTAIFGAPDKPADEVAAAIASGTLSGEQLLAIKQADAALQIRIQEIGLDLQRLEADAEKAYLQDVQDARARQVATRDPTPQVILAVLFTLWAAAFVAFYTLPLPTDDFLRAMIVRAYATIETALPAAIAYFIGSSRGSKQSGDAVRRIAEQAPTK